MIRLRLWLARLLLPRGWVVAHEVNIDPAKMAFWSAASKPNGIGGCGPLGGLRSPSHWDRIPEPPKEPEKS